MYYLMKKEKNILFWKQVNSFSYRDSETIEIIIIAIDYNVKTEIDKWVQLKV